MTKRKLIRLLRKFGLTPITTSLYNPIGTYWRDDDSVKFDFGVFEGSVSFRFKLENNKFYVRDNYGYWNEIEFINLECLMLLYK